MPHLLLSLLLSVSLVLSRRPPPAPAPRAVVAAPTQPQPSGSPSVIGRIPGQLGDSSNKIVSSIGHELGSGIGTVAQGAGEVSGAFGKAIGSVPGAIGSGIGNVGDAGIEEVRNIAEAVGDTVRGAPGVATGIIGGLLNGSRHKRDLTTSDIDLSAICPAITYLEGVVDSGLVSIVAPELIPQLKEHLNDIQNKICQRTDVVSGGNQ